MREIQAIEAVRGEPVHGGGIRDWQRWAPYAAVAWALLYAVLGIYWAVSGRGFPGTPSTLPYDIGPLVGRFGRGLAWLVVILAGAPAAALGAAMLRGVRSRALRFLFLIAGAWLAGVLLLYMTGLELLILLGYIPFVVFSLFSGNEVSQKYLNGLIQWSTLHQVLCLAGGFLWLAATACYYRRSRGACLYCGRRDSTQEQQRPDQAMRWGRIAVSVSMVAPVFYAFTRIAWALGFPLGMGEEFFRRGQSSGMWMSGLFLAAFGLAGAALTLGLVQRWGEVFPRWMIGLSGRRVPIALAVVPASLVSVLLVVGGVAIWSALPQMIARLVAGGSRGMGIIRELFSPIGPTLLFPVWGAALAAATWNYYRRRRGPCRVCGHASQS